MYGEKKKTAAAGEAGKTAPVSYSAGLYTLLFFFVFFLVLGVSPSRRSINAHCLYNVETLSLSCLNGGLMI